MLGKRPSVKNEKQYEGLRKTGMSKERAEAADDRAPPEEHPANARSAGRGRTQTARPRGDEGRRPERRQLYELAEKKDIPSRSKMGRDDLIRALKKAS